MLHSLSAATFVEPLQLNLEPANLLVGFWSLWLVSFLVGLGFRLAIKEHIFGALKQLLFPQVDLSRMQLVFLGDFSNRFDA